MRHPNELRIGDVFIRGGSPGHAVLVVDVAVERTTELRLPPSVPPRGGLKVFLLVQGFLPAQDAHLLRNPREPGLSPWYSADFGEELRTPEWTFRRGDLRRF